MSFHLFSFCALMSILQERKAICGVTGYHMGEQQSLTAE